MDFTNLNRSSNKELERPRSWVSKFYGSFTGMRGIAVTMTFLVHYSIFWHGERYTRFFWTGVDLFFVLSGFLITGILYDSLEDPRFFKNFYIRRSLRIFPVFYAFFFLLFLVTPFLHLKYPDTLLTFFFYFGNLIVPFADLSSRNPTIVSMLHHHILYGFTNIGHLWSLCVEEQFYLIWPAVVWLVRDRRRLMQISGLIIVATLLGRFYLVNHASSKPLSQNLIFWSTYTRCDTILIGSWIALWLRGCKLTRTKLRLIAASLIALPMTFLCIGMSFQPYMKDADEVLANPFIRTAGLTLIALTAAGVVMLSLDESNLFSRFLTIRPLVYLGTISYGFYFIHALPETFLTQLAVQYPTKAILMPVMAFVITLLLAALSFRFYESPILKLKGRLAPGHKSVPSGREEIVLTKSKSSSVP